MARINKVWLGDGEGIDVDSVEEANEILAEQREEEGTKRREVTFEVYKVEDEFIAKAPEEGEEYVGRGRCQWEAISDLANLIDSRAQHFSYGHNHAIGKDTE